MMGCRDVKLAKIILVIPLILQTSPVPGDQRKDSQQHPSDLGLTLLRVFCLQPSTLVKIVIAGCRHQVVEASETEAGG
jgi:hypothetical protein